MEVNTNSSALCKDVIDKSDVDCVLIIAKKSNHLSILSGLQCVDSVKLPSLISMHHSIWTETRQCPFVLSILHRRMPHATPDAHFACWKLPHDCLWFGCTSARPDEAGVTERKHWQSKCHVDWVIIAHWVIKVFKFIVERNARQRLELIRMIHIFSFCTCMYIDADDKKATNAGFSRTVYCMVPFCFLKRMCPNLCAMKRATKILLFFNCEKTAVFVSPVVLLKCLCFTCTLPAAIKLITTLIERHWPGRWSPCQNC